MKWRSKQRVALRIILLVMTFFFLIQIGSAWSTDTFNDSLTSSNFTFTTSQNGTLSLLVPESVPFLTVAQLNLSSAYFGTWNLTYCSYDSISLNTQDAVVTDMQWSWNGSKMYELGTAAANTIYQYSCTTAWDLSTCTYDTVSIAAQDGDSRGIFWKSDGTKLWEIGLTSDKIYEYTCTTAWSLATCSHAAGDWIGTNTTASTGIFWKPDGTRVYECGVSQFWQHDCGTPWEITSCVNNSDYIHSRGAITALFWETNGMYLYELATNIVYQYDCGSDPWNVGACVNITTGYSIQGVASRGLVFSDIGSKMYEADDNNNKFYQHTCGGIPENPWLDIGTVGSREWTHTGELTTSTTKIDWIASAINSYLSGCAAVGGFCYVPFLFHSDTIGVLNYFGMLFSNDEGFGELYNFYNSSSYETKYETFSIGVAYNTTMYSGSAGTLYYDGTAYSGTRVGSDGNVSFIKSIDIPTIAYNTSKNFYWTVGLTNSSGTFYFNSSVSNQTVNNISLGLCGAGESGTVPYINFTFKDEETGSAINASTDLSTWSYYLGSGNTEESFIFSDVTDDNRSFAYCFNPADRTINYDVVYQYSLDGYPQRRYATSGTLTNSTTNVVLYLLSSSDGIYTSFQIVNSEGNVITGATVQVEREFSGTWTLISEGTTDSSGLVTFWLNPNYDHRITVTKTGYVGTTETIRPTQSIYTIVLEGYAGNYTYYSGLEGIYYTKSPTSGIIAPGTHDFTFNVTAENEDMVNCKMELTNSSGYVHNTASTVCTSEAFLSITYAIAAGEDLRGKYYVDVGDGYVLLEGDGNWKGLDANVTRKYTLRGFFEFLSDPSWYENEEERMKYEYTKFVAFFLVFALIIAFANKKTGFDNANPGILLFGLPFLILFVSIAGTYNSVTYAGPSMLFAGRGFFHMQGATAWSFFDNYVIAIYSLLIALGFAFETKRRGG